MLLMFNTKPRWWCIPAALWALEQHLTQAAMQSCSMRGRLEHANFSMGSLLQEAL